MGSGRPTNRRAAFSVWQRSCSVLVLIGRLLLLCRVRRRLGEKKKKGKTNVFSSIPRTRSKVPLRRPPATQHTASRTYRRAFHVTANSIDKTPLAVSGPFDSAENTLPRQCGSAVFLQLFWTRVPFFSASDLDCF